MSIGMVVPDITNPFFPPVVRGAEDVLDRAGYSLLLSSSDNDLGKARRQTAAMLEGQADGLLLAMARRDDPLVADLRAGGTPLVLVNRTIDRVACRRPDRKSTRLNSSHEDLSRMPSSA